MEKLLDKLPKGSRKIIIGIVGGIVLLAGIIMIPYPGPGWVVVFIGLAILAQEFPWAERVLHYARGKYDAWSEWVKHQHPLIRWMLVVLTGLVVVLTLWLLNAYGLIDDWFHLGQDWVHSPLFN